MKCNYLYVASPHRDGECNHVLQIAADFDATAQQPASKAMWPLLGRFDRHPSLDADDGVVMTHATTGKPKKRIKGSEGIKEEKMPA